MSVLFFTLSILSLASNSSNEGYIASFNILRLGDSKKDIPQTAKLLQGFDIVGLVEVMNRDGVEELLDELNKQSISINCSIYIKKSCNHFYLTY